MINSTLNAARIGLAAGLTLFLASAGFGQNANDPNAPATKPETKPAAPATQPDETDEKADLEYVLMKTSKGDILLELNREKAPISVENFLSYTAKEHYDGTIFHRVMSDFMIQGGGFTTDMQKKKTDPPIKNEWQNGLKNERGTIAMARLGGNADSATCQFFLNVVDNAMLDRPQPDGAAYAVFGKVVVGMQVVDTIKNVPVGSSAQNPREISQPTDKVVIETARHIPADEAKKMMQSEAKKGAESRPSN